MCKCKICGKENYEINTKKFPKDFCSYSCYEEWNKFNKEPNCKCVVCGKEMYLKQSRLKRVKNGICCSKECTYKLKSEYMKDDGNHQFNLKGEKNSSFKGIEITHHDYIWEYLPGHPKANRDGRVLQHRLIIENNHNLFDEDFFELIDNFYVLKQEYDVHHKNEIKNDNSLENLQVLTRSEHITLHNLQRKEIIDKYRRIIGVLKQGELLEHLEADNQQPSLDSNILEGSTTNNRVLLKDSNVNTSALLQQIINIVVDDIV